MNKIEDIYPLAPLQQGILFHSLYAPATGEHIMQLRCTISGDLNVTTFGYAWHQVINRHTILRTAFIWENLDEPLQIVNKQVAFSLDQYDWSMQSPEEQDEQMKQFLREDRHKGFDLSRPPLMRISLIYVKPKTYYVIWTCHHILMDGWSLHLLLDEVLTFYGSQQVHLSPAPPYRNYIAWLQKQDLAQAETYWKHLLRGFTEPTHLAIERFSGPSPDQVYEYDTIQLTLPEAVTAQLQALAIQYGLTVNTLVQGAWAILLHHYSGEDNVVFGVTASGRPPELTGVESMVGLFINTLPMRVQFSPQVPFISWVKELQNQQLDLHQYEYSSLLRVQEWSDISRGQPLFESILVFENFPLSLALQQPLENLDIRDVELLDYSNFSLDLDVSVGTEMSLRLIFHRQRFDNSKISRFLDHLRTLLSHIALYPERPLSDLLIFTEKERNSFIHGIVGSQRGYDTSASTIHELFEQQVQQHPNKIAVIFKDCQLSFKDLNAQANRLAYYLIEQGIQPGQFIGLFLEKTHHALIAVLAAFKSGGAYIPLDKSYPQERIQYMLADANPRVLITQSWLEDTLPSLYSGHVVSIDTVNLDAYSLHNPPRQCGTNDLAYVIYTSGTTGNPKGVLVEHGAYIRTCIHFARAYRLDTFSPKSLSLSSISFDVFNGDMARSIFIGHTLVICPDETRLEFDALYELMYREQVNVFESVPIFVNAFMDYIERTKKDLSWFKMLITSSDAWRTVDYRKVKAIAGDGIHVINEYGATEVTIDAMSFEDEGNNALFDTPFVPIGRPFDNVRIYILDNHMQLVPRGCIGEIYIGGPCVARGYLHREDLTTERFLADPFRENGRIYKTGDLGRWLEDGNVEFLGRADNQVKLRGFRIELNEIEVALKQYPTVQDAVVIAREDTTGDKQLLAFITGATDTQTSSLELREFLSTKLPEYMLPSSILAVSTIPITPNGKIDRQTLLNLANDTPSYGVDSPISYTPIEEVVADVWTDIFKLRRISIYENFFELGGHSLVAVQVISRLRDNLQIDIPIRTLFEHPTLKAFSLAIETILKKDQTLRMPRLVPVSHSNLLPLSFPQQRLWFFSLMEPESAAYNTSAALHIKNAINIPALEKSINALIRRHESLRTVFTEVDGQPYQMIQTWTPHTLSVVDFPIQPGFEQEQQTSHYITEEVRRPFDLSTGPLIRTTLLQLSEEEYILIMVLHHIVSDDWSVQVLIRDLVELYIAFLAEKRPVLPELSVQYADYAVWQRQWLQGAALEEHLVYWREHLAGIPNLLELPTDRPRPSQQTLRGSTQTYRLSSTLRDKLKQLSREEGVTLFMTMLAAWQTLLYRYTGQEDIVVGTPIAGRNQAELEGLIGFFVNTLIFRTNLSGNPSFRALLKRVREVALGAYAHQDLPFEKVVAELHPERNNSYNPVVQVIFALQNTPIQPVNLPDLSISPLTVEKGTAPFDLIFYLEEKEDGITGALQYNIDLFDATTITRLLGHYQQLLESILANPDYSLAALTLLTPSEQNQLQIWNTTFKDYPQLHFVHHLFALQAQKLPGEVAVICGEEQLTYQELNCRINKLAHYLQDLGVGPEVCVGICVERSLEMIVAIFGVLKSGGSYLPLDPGYPQERLAFILADAQVAVLLTQERLVSRLPRHNEVLICLDTNWAAIAEAPETEPESTIKPENVAYIIYTSGSTGQPKGTLVTHQNLLHSTQTRFSYYAEPVTSFLLLSSFAFDSSVSGIFWTLCQGGTLVLPQEDFQQDLLQIAGLIAKHKISHLESVPLLYPILLEQIQAQPHALKTVMVAGESCPTDLIEQHFASLPETSFFNEYGPTEGTVWSSVYNCYHHDMRLPVPIGTPIDNVQIHILDRNMYPVAIGVPGEIYIGGKGVVRGYLNLPELTAEKFVPNPFCSEPGLRLYKTGDLASYFPDGNIKFLGRIDQQIKINGYRVELGEIETVLGQHPAVQHCAVTLSENRDGHKQLNAYVVQDPKYMTIDPDQEDQHITHYQAVYDQFYGQNQEFSAQNVAINRSIWTSSYTNRPLPEEEILECVEGTTQRIQSLQPDYVLEIGCGTGLLLQKIAPKCSYYCGLDISDVALNYVREQVLPQNPRLSNIDLYQRAAHNLEGIAIGTFDTVVINEVTQHFPDIGYLVRVIESAISAVKPASSIFIGGVRSLPLLKAFHTSIQLYRAASDLSLVQLHQQIQERVLAERDLVIDPAFFTVLLRSRFPRISEVVVQLKNGHSLNEITQFKYDVILFIDAPQTTPIVPLWIDWQQQKITVSSLRQHLIDAQPEVVGIKHVPNARLVREVRALEILEGRTAEELQTVGELREVLRKLPQDAGIDPEDLWSLSYDLPYTITIYWSDTADIGSYDVLFQKNTWSGTIQSNPMRADENVSTQLLQDYATTPLQGRYIRKLIPQLRSFLQEKLPSYMQPSTFVLLDAIPKTPHGKIDYRLLSQTGQIKSETTDGKAIPVTLAEKVLAEIWADVLGLDEVHINDNFFELGGDSILSVQIVARARQKGIPIIPKQIFDYQTIAELAAILDTLPFFVQSEQSLVTGPVPLHPIQHWFFAAKLPNQHHFNQSLLLEVKQAINLEILKEVVAHLLIHHDALRLRFSHDRIGWQQNCVKPDEIAPVHFIDLSERAEEEQTRAIEALATEMQTRLNLSEGPLFHVTQFFLGSDKPARLLLIAHHLVVDGVSWRILLEDLQTAYQQLSIGKVIKLPLKTTSYKQWTEKLRAYAQSDTMHTQLEYWLHPARTEVQSLPIDHQLGPNTEKTTQTISFHLTREETRLLLQKVPVTYHNKINDVLLTALVQVITAWIGTATLLINVEGHGREDLFEDCDLSRTVGWFTSLFPVLLTNNARGNVITLLEMVKEQLRDIPDKGIGYGVLRYLTENKMITQALQELPQAEISFNYFGQTDQTLSRSANFMVAKEATGANRDNLGVRDVLLEVTCIIANEQLNIQWAYSENFHRRSTIEQLAQGYIDVLRFVIASCQEQKLEKSYASVFPLARLDQQTLERYIGQQQDIEDIYPLSPGQQEILRYALAEPDSSVYLNQLTSIFRGHFNIASFKQACQAVIAHHPTLRTAFWVKDVPEWHQVVFQNVQLSIDEQDWRHLPQEVQQENWVHYCASDYEHKFDLTAAPLLRMAFIRMTDDTYHFLWSTHHLLIDGWCQGIILREVFSCYNAYLTMQKPHLSPSRPFREYIAWLQQQNLTLAKAFWHQELNGFSTPTLLATEQSPLNAQEQQTTYREHAVHLSHLDTSALQVVARRNRITVNTIVQGAWALLLSIRCGKKDVVFGTTMAGRPVELAGIESMIGLFINTLPMRVHISSPHQSVLSWLKELQDQQVSLRQYEYSPLYMVQEWSDIPRYLPLFDSVLRFQNYPNDFSTLELGGELAITDVRSIDRWHYPLSLIAVLEQELRLEISYHCNLFEDATIRQLLTHLQIILNAIAAGSSKQTIADLVADIQA